MSTSGLKEPGDGGGGEDGGLRLEPGEVGGARRSMERLRVEEGEQASADGRTGLVDRAKATWGKLKGMFFMGKKLVVDEMGGGRVLAEELKFLTGGGDEGEIAIVEVNDESDRDSVGSLGRESIGGVSFLECLGEEERDEEVEKKLEGTKKRGREETGVVKLKGLLNTKGWEERESAVREEARWRVKSRERQMGEGGKWEEVEKEERIPLPDNYRLGLEAKGVDLNHSGKFTNGFGKTTGHFFPPREREGGWKQGTGFQPSRWRGASGAKMGGRACTRGGPGSLWCWWWGMRRFPPQWESRRRMQRGAVHGC
jgi:hypothetical protein